MKHFLRSAAAVLAMCMVLSGCGSVEPEESPKKDAPPVGGAKMKETTATGIEEGSEAAENEQASQDEENGLEESFGIDEESEEEAQEENEVPDYDDSLTAAFLDRLDRYRSIRMTYDRYEVKSVEDTTLTATVSVVKYDMIVYERSQDSENTLTETYYTPVGAYSQVTENAKNKGEMQKISDDDGGGIISDTLLLSQAKSGTLVSVDEYSDGSVQEIFEFSSGERYVYAYDGETGALMSVQTPDTTIMVTTFSESIEEIELPDEIQWSYPDTNNA